MTNKNMKQIVLYTRFNELVTAASNEYLFLVCFIIQGS